jgi:hypothetical protein
MISAQGRIMVHKINGQLQGEVVGAPPVIRQPWRAPVLEEFTVALAGAKTRAGAIDGAGGALRYS